MFSCKTEFECDFCGKGYCTEGDRMSSCMSRQRYELVAKKEGWRVVYGKYHICPKCFQHYGRKYIYAWAKVQKNNKSIAQGGGSLCE